MEKREKYVYELSQHGADMVFISFKYTVELNLGYLQVTHGDSDTFQLMKI